MGTANWEVVFIGLLLLFWLVFFVRSIPVLDRLAHNRQLPKQSCCRW